MIEEGRGVVHPLEDLDIDTRLLKLGKEDSSEQLHANPKNKTRPSVKISPLPPVPPLIPKQKKSTHKEDKVKEETDLLHPLPSVKLVIDQECSSIITDEGNGDIDQVEFPHDEQGRSGFDDLDEHSSENLVTVDWVERMETEVQLEVMIGSEGGRKEKKTHRRNHWRTIRNQ